MSRKARYVMIWTLLATLAAGGTASTGNGLWNAYILPGAAHLPGEMGSFWQTDVFLTNPHAARTIVVTMRFMRELIDNTEAPTQSYTLAPGEVLVLDDIVWTVFGETAKGALDIWSDSVFMVTAKTYTGQAGTYGQTVPGQDFVELAGETAFTTGVRNAGSHRANLGVVNCSAIPIDVVADVYDGTGQLLGTRTFELLPDSTEQVSLSSFAGQFAAGYIRWHCTSTDPAAAWIAYASVADNVTNDAVFLDERWDDHHTDRNPTYDLSGTWSGVFSDWVGPWNVNAVLSQEGALVKAWIFDKVTDAYLTYLEGSVDQATISFDGWCRFYSYWDDFLTGTGTVAAGGGSMACTFQGNGYYTGGGSIILNKVSSTASAAAPVLPASTGAPGAPRRLRR